MFHLYLYLALELWHWLGVTKPPSAELMQESDCWFSRMGEQQPPTQLGGGQEHSYLTLCVQPET